VRGFALVFLLLPVFAFAADMPICSNVTPAWNYTTANWLSTLPDATKLSEISMPSAHDAGVADDTAGWSIIKSWCTCQDGPISEQLSNGVRFFDLRMKRYRSNGNANDFAAVHQIEGQSLGSCLDDVSSFLSGQPNETVILRFSHWNSGDDVSPCLSWVRQKLAGRLVSAVSSSSLNDLTLASLRGKVLVVVEGASSSLLGNGLWALAGTSSAATLGVHDSYANKDSLNEMWNDQKAKWAARASVPRSTSLYMLCWQRTLQGVGGIGDDNYDRAANINPRIKEYLDYGIASGWGRPNLVNADFIDANFSRTVINLNLEIVLRDNVKRYQQVSLVTDGQFQNGYGVNGNWSYFSSSCGLYKWRATTSAGLSAKADRTWHGSWWTGWETWCVFLQNGAWIEQEINFPYSGTYRVKLSWTGRPGYGTYNLQVTAGGSEIWRRNVTPNGSDAAACVDRFEIYLETPDPAPVEQTKEPEPEPPRPTYVGVDELPRYATETEARSAVGLLRVAPPNADVVRVISEADYAAMYDLAVKPSGDGWSFKAVLKAAVTNELHQALNAKAVRDELAGSISKGRPRATVATKPGLYYGIAGAADLSELRSVQPENWQLGDGKPLTVEGRQPSNANNGAFFQLKVSDRPL